MKAVRYSVALFAGLVTALLLFWMMQRLITPNEKITKKSVSYSMVDFVRLKPEQREPERKKRMPPKPKPEPMPDMSTPALKTSVPQPQRMPVKTGMPNMAQSTGFAKGPKLSLNAVQGDTELTPLVRINPQYPPRARRIGMEGHVKARLHVDERGMVKSIEIIESEPSGEFDKTVLRTLKRWKFKPKIVDGTAIEYSGTVTIEFKLEK